MPEELSRLILDSRDGITFVHLKDAELFKEEDSREIGDLLNAILDAKEPRLIIDLERVDAAGSMFFGMLMQVRKVVLERGGKIALAAPSIVMKTSIKVAARDKTMPVTETVDQAIAKVA